MLSTASTGLSQAPVCVFGDDGSRAEVAITYSEFAITSRTRLPALAVGTKVYCPASGAAAVCGVIDTTTDTYSEFATANRTWTRAAVVVGTKIYLATSGTVVGIIDTATNSYSEMTVTSRQRAHATLVGTKIYLPTHASTVYGVIETTTNTYSEFTATSQSANNAVLVGTKLYMPANAVGSCTVLDTTTNTGSTFGIQSWGYGRSVLAGTELYVLPGSSTRRTLIDTTTNTSTTANVGFGSLSPDAYYLSDGKIYAPAFDQSYYAIFDTVAGTQTTATITSRPRIGCALVGSKLYMPSNGQAICGVLSGLPVPAVNESGRRGLGLIRG